MSRRFWFQAATAGTIAVMLGMAPARAEEAASYPSRNIRVVVAFGAGGPPDLVARIVASGLEHRLGKAAIVENITGASGIIAAKNVARSAPDGYTLMLVDMSFIVARHAAVAFDIDPLKAFKAVGLAARAPFTLIVPAPLPANNLSEFVKLAKDKPDSMMIGHSGIGTTPHLAYLSFANATGIKPRLVPYRSASDGINNMLSGDISGFFTAASGAMTALGSDKLKVLGITGDKRSAKMPNIPTFAEAGIDMKGFEEGGWYGVVVPTGTPDDIIAKLSATLNDVTKDDNLRGRLAASGIEMTSGTPEAFHTFMSAQDAYWGKTLRDAGISPQ